jgi:hypothetical protein
MACFHVVFWNMQQLMTRPKWIGSEDIIKIFMIIIGETYLVI